MEWTVRLEACTTWGEVRTFEIGKLFRRVNGLTADEVGLMLDEAKTVLAELQRCIVQTQIDEQVTCSRVCSDCLAMRQIRDRRTRTLQTLFGTVTVDAPRVRLCGCVDKGPFDDVSFSPLSDLLPDRCTPELRCLQAELGARHSFREAARYPGHVPTLLTTQPRQRAQPAASRHQGTPHQGGRTNRYAI